ncbi:MAG: NYN domain-containing protein [Synergistaceae bacterium]|nr:NYN domain-containing protein [Synergistaceae bacterium]
MKTAILVDGAYFIYRARKIFGSLSPSELATRLQRYSCYHLPKEPSNISTIDKNLYRIFFYDCPPLNKKMEHPLTKKQIDYSKSERAKWRLELHDVLKRKPKVALRLGVVDDINCSWVIADKKIRKLCRGEITVKNLEEDDVTLSVKQKGVDMRIGLDIASMSYKKQVERIVLIAGDSDFVPAAKLARREGIEFILDPMWGSIKPDLQEHIDRLRSTFPRPKVPLATPDEIAT